MDIFKYQNLFIPSLILFVIFTILYLKLSSRSKKLFEIIFDKEIITQIIPSYLEERRKIKDILIIIALFLLIISILGPQLGIEYREKPLYGANIALVVDTSLSMSAQDIKPNRLESVKLVLKSISEIIKGYRITIIAFQDKAYIQCPLTDDIDAVLYFTDILKPNMLPYPGTNISDAIVTTYEYLSSYPGENIAVFFTDGEDHSGKVKDALLKINKDKIKFITVGIGSPEGNIIYDPEKNEPKKDRSGKTVISRLDEKTLIDIANYTEGKYIKYTTPEFVVSEIKKYVERREISKNFEKQKYYKNRYQYFLILAFILIFVEFIIMEIPKSLVLILFIIISSPSVYSLDIKSEFKAQKGNKFYKNKDYQKSFETYKKALEEAPNNEKIKFNTANSLYKLNLYDEAIKIYDSIKNRKLMSQSLYNTGNSYYMKNDIEKAIEYYKKAILENPKNEDAKYNLELLLKKKNSSSSSSSSSSSQGGGKDEKKEGGGSNNKKENNNEQKQNTQSSSQTQKQAEKFLEMIKNMERENIKKATQQQKVSGDIKNEFDW
ncbi:MAG: VWA domain-containing protein [Elusimicrobiales bacterium]|nr:VWA domain-containing protein [Elusimicrobiales bacterium]